MTRLVGFLAFVALVLGFGAVSSGAPPKLAVTPEQIEADWLRQDELRGSGVAGGTTGVSTEEDAAGALDGVIDGKWGFHTLNEADPWWRVDLEQPTSLDRIVLYNRGDGFAERNARIMVLLSDDGKTFDKVYQHDGTVFHGHADKKPLVVKLDGARARYVRLQLPGTNYFHLDEVQVYAAGQEQNIGLGKPANQSSTSEWSARHVVIAAKAREYLTAPVIERGLKLAQALRRLGAKIDAYEQTLQEVAAELGKLPADAPEPVQRQLYMKARWAVRRMALSNPLLDFDKILFAKRVPPAFPHMSDQYYGWWSREGGGMYVLEGFKGDKSQLCALTADWEGGSFLRPDLSYDGRKVVFAYARFYPHVHGIGDKVNKENLPEDAFYKVYEMNVDGSGMRRLTHGKYDDFDTRYLPSGEIVFLSTRKGQSIQVSRCSAAATAQVPDLPDSYVRCGGGNSRPVPVFTLHCMGGDGSNLRPISAFENFEWTRG